MEFDSNIKIFHSVFAYNSNNKDAVAFLGLAPCKSKRDILSFILLQAFSLFSEVKYTKILFIYKLKNIIGRIING